MLVYKNTTTSKLVTEILKKGKIKSVIISSTSTQTSYTIKTVSDLWDSVLSMYLILFCFWMSNDITSLEIFQSFTRNEVTFLILQYTLLSRYFLDLKNYTS